MVSVAENFAKLIRYLNLEILFGSVHCLHIGAQSLGTNQLNIAKLDYKPYAIVFYCYIAYQTE